MYKGAMQRDLDTVNVRYIEPFKDLVKALSMETWALRLSMFKSIPVGVGKIDYEPKYMMDSVKGLKKDAIRRLTNGGSGVVIG